MRTRLCVRKQFWLWVAFLSVSYSFPLLADEAITLSFAVVPQQSATRLAQLWTPVCDAMNRNGSYRFVFKTAKDIPTFEERLAAGEYDLAYMNPYHYTVFSKTPGYVAFARESGRFIQGLIVVKNDSPFRSIAELEGKTLAFPAPAAFASSLLPQAYLVKNGIRIRPAYVNSHDSVYLTVSRGIYEAGGGIQRTYDNMPEAVRNRLRILWKTPTYTSHAFAAHPRVPTTAVEYALAALVALSGDESGQKLLQHLGFNPIGTAQDSDWDDVRELGINILEAPRVPGASGN